mmetsp:Transcript_56189/g.180362  ORF Transcript_56189/g.180362 Transcript_56189/m.180362 type:complete len:249 (+) Transcript_56189:85-831(+)
MSGEPPAKRRLPEVPRFLGAAAGRCRSSEAEEERRRKAGLPPTTNVLVPQGIEPARKQQAGPPAPDARASRTPMAVSGTLAVGLAPRATPLPTGPAAGPGPSAAVAGDVSGVYGFAGPSTTTAGSKAIALRLEPLKQGLPEFERVLGESKQSITIGSARGTADVVVHDEGISKRHASLVLIGVNGELALAVVDTSTNGTFVNGKPLLAKKKRFRIRSGDVLQIKDPHLDEEFGWKLDFGNTVAYFTRA